MPSDELGSRGEPGSSADPRSTAKHGLAGLLTRYERWRTDRGVWISWLLTRLLILLVFALFEPFVVGDVLYYHRKISELFDVGLGRTFNEYPTPVTWLLWLPYGLTGGYLAGYVAGFILLMLALDAALLGALWRLHRRSPSASSRWALDFWILYVLLIGPLSYLRFDMLPAVLAGGALLAARRRPWVTGALTGLGAAIKLWPALLIPAFLAHRPDRKVAGWSFLGVGVGLAVVSLLIGGWSRLVSPLTWQSGRGLQVESIWATPVMIVRAVRPSSYVVEFSKFQAYEIFGAGVSPLLRISDVATLLGLATILVLFARAYRHRAPSPVAIGLVILATVAIMIVTNKTLSPQYLLWLGGPMAALLVLAEDEPDDRRSTIRRLAGQILVLALLTHLVYPLFYDGLIGRKGHAMIVVATVITAVRNLALVLFTVMVCRTAWRFLARSSIPRGT